MHEIANIAYATLGSKFRERLADLEVKERRRVTFQEVAEATGLSCMTLSKLINENGANVQTAVLDRLCRFFECRLEELVEYVASESETDPLRGGTDVVARRSVTPEPLSLRIHVAKLMVIAAFPSEIPCDAKVTARFSQRG